MAIQLQLRKGTKVQNDAFTGAEGELTYDSTTKGLRIHDGSTQGGIEIPTLVAVQRPTADNDYTWYRKWSDGWVEQGGISNASTSGVSVNLPIEMTDANYTVVVGNGETTTNSDYTAYCSGQNRTATSFSFYVKGYGGDGTSYRCCWQVSGMAAE